MTGSYGLILPLMIANMTAYGLARHFRPVPIYEALLVQDDIHLPHGKRGISHALERIHVGDVFRADAVVLDSNLTVAQALEHVQNYEFTTFPVIGGQDQCVGVITEMRLRRNLAAGEAETPISEIADKCRSIYPDELLNAAVVKMNHSRVRQLAVIERSDEQKFLGIVTMTDIVRAQAEAIAGAPDRETL
jgi:CIC family chloride channel protein